ncbi:phospholipase D-like domain-containing protein [Xanthobacter versatilis]|uniref:phospholipase D-like domain-containing protein n=1 Tax=Xanthobacter autotrophicus (strain ATCC BAA-1158 / Py2) TaxID=78245 RepID=UPI0037271920
MKDLALAVLLALSSPALAETTVHYSPTENLERIDLGLIRSAKSSIDFAGYAVTDWVIADELVRAAERGVAVRMVLDPTQRHVLDRLAPIIGSIRKKPSKPIMHLKSYAIDGKVLRTGSANFSPSGLKQQDNDLVVIRDDALAARFKVQFDRIWEKATPVEEPPK